MGSNHRLTEPWRFFVVAGQARNALGDAMVASQAASLAELDEAAQAAIAKARAKPLRAPVIIAVAVEPFIGPKVIEIEEVEAGAAAIQNMLLAAPALGLAAMWRTGEASYDPYVKAFFGLAPTSHILGFVYVGYPDMTALEARRRPAAEVTRWMGWVDADNDPNSDGRPD